MRRNTAESAEMRDRELDGEFGDAGAVAYGAQGEVGEGADQERRVVERGHHVEIADAERLGLLARLDIDFVQCLDVLGEERNRDHEHAAHAFARQPFDRSGERRLQPLLRADLALEAERVRILPRAKLAEELYGGRNMLRVGIALFDERNRQAVRAENEMHVVGARQLAGTLFVRSTIPAR